jgi:tetratricopeptide (TPR) repeat protein
MRAEAEQAGDPATQARAWNGLARSWVRRDNQAILENAIRAEAAARATASQPELVRALFYQGWAQYRLKAVEAAVDMAEQALTLSRQLEMRPEMAQSWQLLGRIRAELMGDYAQAIDNHRRALALFEALGDQVMVADTLSNLGETYRFQGDYRTAASFYEEALALATGSGYRDGQMVFRSNLGGARVGLGDYRAAEADLSQVIAMPEAEQWLALAEAYGFLAEAYLGQGHGDKALHAARQALAVGQQRAQPEYIAAAWRVLGLIAAESPQPIVIGETAYDAPACLAESLRLFSDLRLEAERARTLRRWAVYALKQGDRSRGQAMWQEARETFARLGLDLEVERMDGGEGVW